MRSNPEEALLVMLCEALKSGDAEKCKQVAATARAGGVSAKLLDAIQGLQSPTTAAPPRRSWEGSMAEGLGVSLASEQNGRLTVHNGDDRFSGSTEALLATWTNRHDGWGAFLAEARASGQAVREVGDHRVWAARRGDSLWVGQRDLGPRTLAEANHELSNGLTAISAMASLAARQGHAPELCREISAAADKTLRAVRGLEQPVCTEEVSNAAETLEEPLRELQPLAQAQGVRLEWRLGTELPVRVAPMVLRSVVGNLVKNAIEAVGLGGRVSLAAYADHDRLRVVVSDDGPGLPKGAMKKVFEPGFSSKGSLGLGLSLVKRLVKDAGGEVHCEQGLRRGARFVVTLPLGASVAPPAQPTAPKKPSSVRIRARWTGTAILLLGPAAEALGETLRDVGAWVFGPQAGITSPDVVIADGSLRDEVIPPSERCLWLGAAPDGHVALPRSPSPERLFGAMQSLLQGSGEEQRHQSEPALGAG